MTTETGKTGIEIHAVLGQGGRMRHKLFEFLHLTGLEPIFANMISMRITLDGAVRTEPLYEAHFVECPPGEHEITIAWHEPGPFAAVIEGRLTACTLKLTVAPGQVTALHTPPAGPPRPRCSRSPERTQPDRRAGSNCAETGFGGRPENFGDERGASGTRKFASFSCVHVSGRKSEVLAQPNSASAFSPKGSWPSPNLRRSSPKPLARRRAFGRVRGSLQSARRALHGLPERVSPSARRVRTTASRDEPDEQAARTEFRVLSRCRSDTAMSHGARQTDS